MRLIDLDDLMESLRCKYPSINNLIGFCHVEHVTGVGIVTAIDRTFVKCQVNGVDYKQEKWDALSNVHIRVLAEVMLGKFEAKNDKMIITPPPATIDRQDVSIRLLTSKFIDLFVISTLLT